MFIDSIGFGVVMPVIPTLVMTLEHGTLTEATRTGGWLVFACALMQSLFGALIGGLGDRFGQPSVLLGALRGFVVDYPLMGFRALDRMVVPGPGAGGTVRASYGPAWPRSPT